MMNENDEKLVRDSVSKLVDALTFWKARAVSAESLIGEILSCSQDTRALMTKVALLPARSVDTNRAAELKEKPLVTMVMDHLNDDQFAEKLWIYANQQWQDKNLAETRQPRL